MNRESIIVIICIGVIALFYLFQVDSAPVKELDLVKEPAVQSLDDIKKQALQQIPKGVSSISTIPNSLDNKDNQLKQNCQVKVITAPVPS